MRARALIIAGPLLVLLALLLARGRRADEPAGERQDRQARSVEAEVASPAPARSSTGAERASSGRAPPQAKAPADEGDADTRAVRVTGVVLFQGATVAGAEVRLRGDDYAVTSTLSGPDGRFSFALRGRWYAYLDAQKGDGLRGTVLVPLSRRSVPDQRIELEPAGVVLMTVTSPRVGGPVEGAMLAGAQMPPDGSERRRGLPAAVERFEAKTDAAGRAKFLISRSGRYELEIDKKEVGSVVREVELEIRDTPQVLSVELPLGGAVAGRVIDEQGQPLKGVEVMLPGHPGRFFGYRNAVSGASGEFRFEGVEPGSYWLRTTSSDYPPVELSIEKKDDLNDLMVDLVQPRGLPIQGRVLDESDRPLPGWVVAARRTGPMEESVTRRVRSAEDGAFLLPGCPPGQYELWLARPEENWGAVVRDLERTAQVSAGARGLVLRGPLGATLEGAVRFEGAAAPDVCQVALGDLEQTLAGTEPRFLFDDLRAGTISVRASAEGFLPAEQWVQLYAGQTTRALLALRPAHALSGMVRDPSGAAIAGAMVTERGTKQRVSSDANGRFVIQGLGAGEVALLAEATGFVGVTAGPFAVGPDAPSVDIQLEPGVRVSGRARFGAQPAAGGQAHLVPPGLRASDAPSPSAYIAPDGSFSLEGVAVGPGELILMAERDGPKSGSVLKSIPLVVPPEGLRDLDLDLQRSGARLVVSMPPVSGEALMVVLLEGHHTLATLRATGRLAGETREAATGERQVVFEAVDQGEHTLFYGPKRVAPGQSEPMIQYLLIAPGQTEAQVTLLGR